jgi:integrase
MKLTEKTIAGLQLPAGLTDKIYFDDALPRFGYRLQRSGDAVRCSWIVQYRRAGRTRRMTLGAANLFSVEQARKEATKILGFVATGEDPQADRIERRAKDRLTLSGFVTEYLKVKTSEVRPKTLSEIRRYLTGPTFKPLHDLPVDTIRRKDISARLIAITRDHGPSTAVRAREALHAFFVWSIEAGHVDQNPVVGTSKPKLESSRDRVLNNNEIVAVWRAAGDDAYGKIVQLLILTGARRGEIGGLRWTELSQDGTWTLPGKRAKNKHKLILPLPPTAWAIINSVPRQAGRDLLFGERTTIGFTTWGRAKAALDQRLGDQIGEPFTLHDIRRTVATGMADLGVLPHVIEAALNHQSGHKKGIAGVYNRSPYSTEVKAALALWAEHVRSLVDGEAPKIVVFPSLSAS